MWRFIFIAAIFISAFFRSSGDAQIDYEELILPYHDCPAVPTASTRCLDIKRYCSATELASDIPDSSLATRGCREGFTHDTVKNICIGKVDRGAPVMGCPTECYEKDGQCMHTALINYICTSYRHTHDCGGLSYLHHGERCPDGYRTDPAACIWARTSNIYCPSGILIDGKRCSTNQICPNRLHCRIGDLENNRCMETVKRSLEWVCQQESLKFRCLEGTKHGSSCTDTVTVDPVLTCPDNYPRVPTGDQCRRACPHNYFRVEDEGCFPISTEPTTPLPRSY